MFMYVCESQVPKCSLGVMYKGNTSFVMHFERIIATCPFFQVAHWVSFAVLQDLHDFTASDQTQTMLSNITMRESERSLVHIQL